MSLSRAGGSRTVTGSGASGVGVGVAVGVAEGVAEAVGVGVGVAADVPPGAVPGLGPGRFPAPPSVTIVSAAARQSLLRLPSPLTVAQTSSR